MSKEWDRANMKSMGVNMKKEEVEAFKAYAEENHTTAGALLRGFVRATLGDKTEEIAPERLEGYPHIVSYKNTDRLKHETAFHNPRHKNPNGVLNDILDDYFNFVEKVRKRSL